MEIGFLARRRFRESSRELTQLLVLGFGISFILMGVGAYKYFIVIGAWDALWKAAMWGGVAALLVTLIVPYFWLLPERVLRKFGNWVGHGLMKIILVAVYYGLIWPVGAIMRSRRGTHPLYAWGAQPTEGMEGWHGKTLPYDVANEAGSGNLGLYKVLLFFVRQGHFLLLPVLIVLISLGVALFFLQTSALAPFIYTLF
ncbi:DUF5989 family protein [Methylogaea oryzae]|uniref:DUF5989 family protein n=1 Tax=Methylogaea oryzae TaxID=1295382 RepID=UPI0006D1A59E|nr:DUF5989 family protein [Methylogaea oryzae]